MISSACQRGQAPLSHASGRSTRVDAYRSWLRSIGRNKRGNVRKKARAHRRSENRDGRAANKGRLDLHLPLRLLLHRQETTAQMRSVKRSRQRRRGKGLRPGRVREEREGGREVVAEVVGAGVGGRRAQIVRHLVQKQRVLVRKRLQHRRDRQLLQTTSSSLSRPPTHPLGRSRFENAFSHVLLTEALKLWTRVRRTSKRLRMGRIKSVRAPDLTDQSMRKVEG